MIFFELRRETWGSSRVETGPQGPLLLPQRSQVSSSCEGQVGIPLQSLPANRALSRVQSVDSVFLTRVDRDLRLPIKLQLGSQA